MIDERLRELVNREVDGENTPEESRRLRDALDSDPEARRYYADLAELGRRFEDAGGIDPPPVLRRAILESTTRASATRGNRSPSTAGRPSLLDSLREAVTPRLAYAFAAGVAACAILFVLLDGPGRRETRVPPDAARGTMAPRNDGGEGASGILEFDLPEANGAGTVSYSPGEIRVGVSDATRGEVSVVLSFEDTAGSAPAAVRVYSGDSLILNSPVVPPR